MRIHVKVMMINGGVHLTQDFPRLCYSVVCTLSHRLCENIVHHRCQLTIATAISLTADNHHHYHHHHHHHLFLMSKGVQNERAEMIKSEIKNKVLCFLFSFFFICIVYVCNNSYTVIGGQHRWAPAYLPYYLLHAYFFG